MYNQQEQEQSDWWKVEHPLLWPIGGGWVGGRQLGTKRQLMKRPGLPGREVDEKAIQPMTLTYCNHRDGCVWPQT